MKKMVCLCAALILALMCLVSCAIGATEGSSSMAALKESSNVAVQSGGANSSTVSTTSRVFDRTPTEESGVYSNRTPLRSNAAENNKDETASSSVKVYKNKRTVQLGAYAFRLNTCNANGYYEGSQLEEYSSVINEGYFNTYFVPSDADVLTQVKLIAESGGTFWLHVGDFRKSKGTIQSYIEDAKFYVDLLKSQGYGEILNGFYWDEPVWRGMTNEEFFTMTKALYQTFGLRNFPVFATGEFSGLEGNEIGTDADDMNKVMTSSLTYVTDVAFDAYGVDVRDGAVPTAATLEKWRDKISPNVNTTKDYYTEYKKKLQAHVGHPVTIWYYPCCYAAPVGTGLNNIKRADEGYCLGHLEFMAEDILKEPYAGGLVLYSYSGDTGLAKHITIKDAKGNYKYYPDEEKWESYCAALKRICKKFNSTKSRQANIGV